jgi:hypothetical protein
MTKNRILIVARDADLRASLARWLIGAARRAKASRPTLTHGGTPSSERLLFSRAN